MAGSTISAPAMLKPPLSAAAFTSASLPTRMGLRKLSFSSSAAASRIRASVPSVKTMVLGLCFSFSIMDGNWNFSIFDCLL